MLNRTILFITLIAYAIFTWWFIGATEIAGQQIARAEEELSKKSPTPVAIVRFEGVKQGLVVPAWQWLNDDRVWSLASAKSPISTDYVPKLTSITVAKGPWMYDDQIHPEVNQALEKLFTHAKDSNQPLIVTSAYRSAADQQDLYASSTANYGAEWAASHVAKPGQSEHQTGLAVDFSSYTTSCLEAFAGCNLRTDTANWLAINAADFGFILRYPPSKSHITGISHEPWHYRYVGEKMSKIVRDSGLTFDEVIDQLRAHQDAS